MIVLQCARQCIEYLMLSPRGRLAVPWSNGVSVWDEVGRDEPFVVPLRWVSCVRFTPDDRTMLLAGWSSVAVCDLATKQLTPIEMELPSWAHADLTPDGGAAVFIQSERSGARSGRIFCRLLSDLSRSVWSVETNRRVIGSPLFLPGGERFVVVELGAYRTGVTYVTRDARTGAIVSEAAANDQRLDTAVLSADRRLVAMRATNRIAVFRAEDFTIPPTFILNDSRKEYTGAAFHPSGRFLAATSNDNTVKLYDTTTWQMAHAFDWQIGRLRSIAFSPDGMLAAAGGDRGKIVVWDFDL